MFQEIQHLHDIQRDLEEAIFISDLDMIKICLKHGACPTDQFTGDPKSCFTVACEKACHKGTFDILEEISQHMGVSDMDIPLIVCCGANGPYTVQVCTWLLEQGADPNAEDGVCLQQLLQNEHMETEPMNDILTQLVNHGLDLTLPERMLFVWTICATMRTPSRIDGLLKHGADPNMCVNGITPLSLACHDGNHAMVKLLLAHGATKLGDFPGTAVVHNRFTPPDPESMTLLREHGLL